MTSNRPLTFDEKKAAEAAFLGLPPDPNWSTSAHGIYLGIMAQAQRRGLAKNPALVSAL